MHIVACFNHQVSTHKYRVNVILFIIKGIFVVVFKATHNLKQFTFYSHRKKWCKNKNTHEQGFQNCTDEHLPSTQSRVVE